jgi:hypothetical protein
MNKTTYMLGRVQATHKILASLYTACQTWERAKKRELMAQIRECVQSESTLSARIVALGGTL